MIEFLIGPFIQPRNNNFEEINLVIGDFHLQRYYVFECTQFQTTDKLAPSIIKNTFHDQSHNFLFRQYKPEMNVPIRIILTL